MLDRHQIAEDAFRFSGPYGLGRFDFVCFLVAGRVYLGITDAMTDAQRLAHTSAMVLQAIGAGPIYGYTVIASQYLSAATVAERLYRDRNIRSISTW